MDCSPGRVQGPALCPSQVAVLLRRPVEAAWTKVCRFGAELSRNRWTARRPAAAATSVTRSARRVYYASGFGVSPKATMASVTAGHDTSLSDVTVANSEYHGLRQRSGSTKFSSTKAFWCGQVLERWQVGGGVAGIRRECQRADRWLANNTRADVMRRRIIPRLRRADF